MGAGNNQSRGTGLAGLLLVLLLLPLSWASAGPDPCLEVRESYPKSTVAYLAERGAIVVDGDLSEAAWEEVGALEPLVNILGEGAGPAPWYDSRIKFRWDEESLYIAVRFEEEQIWANQTEHNDPVYLDNAFEVFIDPGGQNHWYKEYQINALNVDWDLEMSRPYSDGGQADSSWEMAPEKQNAVFVDGRVNDPQVPARFWTVELALPLAKLAQHHPHAAVPPRHGDLWRINVSRVQYQVMEENGRYVQVPGTSASYWLWNPHLEVNMHRPDYFGYLMFSKDSVNSTAPREDEAWPARHILHQVYYAQLAHQKQHGVYAGSVEQLDLADYIKQGLCAPVPKISLTSPLLYLATLPFSPSPGTNRTASIRQDRLFQIL